MILAPLLYYMGHLHSPAHTHTDKKYAYINKNFKLQLTKAKIVSDFRTNQLYHQTSLFCESTLTTMQAETLSLVKCL